MTQLLLTCVIFSLTLSLTAAIIGFSNDDVGILRKHSIEQRHTIITNYTRVLNFWKEHKRDFVFQGQLKDVVLVLGNTGAGKTTLVSALIGRKLTVTKSDGYLVIVDEEDRIGKGVSSKTLVPEVVSDKNGDVTYIDCSGFRDNRNIEYEISSLYFQNILLNQVQRVKLILVINYDSLKVNGNKNDFDDLFEHIGEFITDISKFHEGIALVATKVENTYEVADDGSLILSNDDASVLDGIAQYLKRKKDIYLSKTDNLEKYRQFVNLLDILLQKNNKLYKRIAIFRQPMGQGLLEKLPRSKKEINTIAKMIVADLAYVEKQKDDFGFALSTNAKITVDQIIDNIFRNALTNRIDQMGKATITHYLKLEKQYSDIGLLYERVSQADDLISEIIKHVDDPRQLFEEFLNTANTLNISVSLTNLKIISDDIKALKFFTTVSIINEDMRMMLLKNRTQNIADWIRNLRNIYEFLNNVHENLAVYNSQELKNDTRIEHILTTSSNSEYKVIQDIGYLESIVKEIGSDRIYQKTKTLKLNQVQLKILRHIFSAFAGKLECSCTSQQMTVKGYNVRMKDVLATDCWAQAKVIQIFALNKIFLDSTIEKTGAEVQLFIFAPTWEIVGGPKIILDGQAGQPHEEESAKSARFPSENGEDGAPGLPGGPAGHFFGFVKHFINSKNLEIHANGGRGGPGQNGGNGADGVAGQEPSESFIKGASNIGDIEKYLKDRDYMFTVDTHKYHTDIGLTHISSGTAYDIDVSGKSAVMPTNGGNGGSGGQGGYPGRIVINSLGKFVPLKTYNETGPSGLKGQGGHGGRGASNGRGVKFRLSITYMSFDFIGQRSIQNIEWIDGTKSPNGKDGKPGIRDKNKEVVPTTLPLASLYPVITAFKAFVRKNLFENIQESQLKHLLYELENDNQIKAQYNTLAFVKELEILENQCHEFRNKIDFAPFYSAFLTRVEVFAKNEKMIEHKKVLSYIYTAALTKLFTIKKRKEGKTVVNLSQYLSIIERSVEDIRDAQNLQTVINYQKDYETSLHNKIREANDFIQNKIEPQINKLLQDSDNQISVIIDEIKANKNSTEDAITSLEKNRAKIRDLMRLKSMLLPLKFAASSLSLCGPLGASVGVAITSSLSISEGMLLDTTSSQASQQKRIHSVDPNMKLLSRITKVFNNKPQQLADKLADVVARLEKHKEELSTSQTETNEISQKIEELKSQTDELKHRKTSCISDIERRNNDAKKIEKELNHFINSRKIILEKETTQMDVTESENKSAEQLKKEIRIKNALRRIKDVQSILDSVEVIVSVYKELQYDEGMIRNINEQISGYVDQLKDLEKLENQVYDIIIPDIRQMETTINTIIRRQSINGSSHAKLDVTKWTVQTSLRDVKSLLQKFTTKMSFEIQSNLKRYIEKIDEGFSILIDIYDRIDSYSDSVKQAEYMAHIVSAPMSNIQVMDAELRSALVDLKLIIQSNMLFEKYATALRAFKQHYFPFAAHVLKRFQLPEGMLQLKNMEILRSNIMDKIKDMRNHIDESEATIGEYSKFTHDNNIFNSNTTGTSPFYVWKYDTIKDELQELLKGSEILIKADITKALNYNAVKFCDIGINFRLKNENFQNKFTATLKNFTLTMTMFGNNYYRCGEQYYFISFDDDVTISYILNQDETKNWINPNSVYTTIRNSHAFLSPYGLWSIKLKSVDENISFDWLERFSNEAIDLELIGRGHYIEQDSDFNFNICNGYLDEFYNAENIARTLA